MTAENARPGEEPWPTVSASAVPAAPGWPTPHALTVDELAEVRDAFVAATRRVAGRRASTSSRCTPPTATCSTSSSPR